MLYRVFRGGCGDLISTLFVALDNLWLLCRRFRRHRRRGRGRREQVGYFVLFRPVVDGGRDDDGKNVDARSLGSGVSRIQYPKNEEM
jgi:hypothetical protein